MKVAHPAVSGGLNLLYGTGGTFAGFDRLGRIIDQKWENDSSTVKDRYGYGYDGNSNRQWRENLDTSVKDEYYTYDNLDRLNGMERGNLNETYTGINVPNAERGYRHDALGNWTDFYMGVDQSLEQTRTHNEANETTGIDETTGTSWIDPAYDAVGNMNKGPHPGGSETTRLQLVYDAWNRLGEVWQDDGDGTLETEGSPPDDTQLAEYRYDGRHRRIKKTDKPGQVDRQNPNSDIRNGMPLGKTQEVLV